MIAQQAIHMHRARLRRASERLAMWIAWHLPKWLVTWAYIRVAEHGITGREFGGTVPQHLDIMTCLRRWDGVQR